MIEIMTAQNDNESKQLSFPLQINDDLEAPMTADELATDLRLRIARLLNRVTAGEQELTQDRIAWINRVNALLVRGNYSPVPVDFCEFEVDQNSKPCLVSSSKT